MSNGRFAVLATTAFALVLGGCGGGSSDGPSFACPPALTVQDAGRIVHFKDGTGRDPRDVAYEAALVSAGSACSVGRNQVDVTVVMVVAVKAGPSVSSGQTGVPYFVRVLDGRGTILQGQDFVAEFRLSPSSPRGESREELALTLPLSQAGASSGYRIAVGLRPSPEELNYNRREAGR